MFIRYFLELPLPHQVVEQALLRDPDAWVPGLARDAEVRGSALLAEVGFAADGHTVRKEVVITFGAPIRVPAKTILPMSWEATLAPSLFPSLDADVEVAALGPGRTQLSVNGRYRPPLGLVGRAIDRALLHRVAEATLKDFLDRMGERLLELAHAAP